MPLIAFACLSVLLHATPSRFIEAFSVMLATIADVIVGFIDTADYATPPPAASFDYIAQASVIEAEAFLGCYCMAFAYFHYDISAFRLDDIGRHA